MIEIWREYRECGYKFSSLGRVKSPKGILLKGMNNGKGYLMVDIRYSEKRKYLAIHSAIAELFLGKRPSHTHQINHKDGDKRNNSIGNLEYVSPSENVRHSHILGKAKKKLSPKEVLDLVKMSKDGFLKEEIASKFNIDKSWVSSILSGKSWSYLTGINKTIIPRFGEGSPGAKLREKRCNRNKKAFESGSKKC